MDHKKKKELVTPSRMKQELITPSRMKQELITPSRMKQEVITPRLKKEKSFSALLDDDKIDSEYWNSLSDVISKSLQSKQRREDSDSDSDTRSESPVRTTRFRAPVLDHIVSSPIDFDTVDEPGPLTVRAAKQDHEYYIFRFPKGLIKPEDLPNTKLSMGGKGPRRLEVKNKTYEVSTYRHSVVGDTPTLFLPDESGQLRQVDLKIAGQIVMKDSPLDTIETGQKFNIDDLRRKTHRLPEIKERNFFGSCGPSPCDQPPVKKRKISKKGKRLSKGK